VGPPTVRKMCSGFCVPLEHWSETASGGGNSFSLKGLMSGWKGKLEEILRHQRKIDLHQNGITEIDERMLSGDGDVVEVIKEMRNENIARSLFVEQMKQAHDESQRDMKAMMLQIEVVHLKLRELGESQALDDELRKELKTALSSMTTRMKMMDQWRERMETQVKSCEMMVQDLNKAISSSKRTEMNSLDPSFEIISSELRRHEECISHLMTRRTSQPSRSENDAIHTLKLQIMTIESQLNENLGKLEKNLTLRILSDSKRKDERLHECEKRLYGVSEGAFHRRDEVGSQQAHENLLRRVEALEKASSSIGSYIDKTLDEKLGKRDATIHELSDQINKLKKSIENKRHEESNIEDLKNSLKAYGATMKDTSEDVKALKAEMKDHEDQIDALETQFDENMKDRRCIVTKMQADIAILLEKASLEDSIQARADSEAKVAMERIKERPKKSVSSAEFMTESIIIHEKPDASTAPNSPAAAITPVSLAKTSQTPKAKTPAQLEKEAKRQEEVAAVRKRLEEFERKWKENQSFKSGIPRVQSHHPPPPATPPPVSAVEALAPATTVTCTFCKRTLPGKNTAALHEKVCDRKPADCGKCGKSMTVREKRLHESKCKGLSEEAACPHCDEALDKSEIEDHVLQCDWRPSKCKYCGTTIILRDIAKHENRCAKRTSLKIEE